MYKLESQSLVGSKTHVHTLIKSSFDQQMIRVYHDMLGEIVGYFSLKCSATPCITSYTVNSPFLIICLIFFFFPISRLVANLPLKCKLN